MADPNLKIRIATEAELGGIKQTQAGLKDLSDQARQTQGDLGGVGGAGGGIGAGAGAVAAGVGLSGIIALGASARALIGNLSEGAQSAITLAREINGLDESARRAATAGMGPLGDLIAQNSPALLEFAANIEQIQRQFDGLWTAAGARLVPALNEITSALAGIDTTQFGSAIGDAIGGAIVYLTDLESALAMVMDSFAGSSDGTALFTAQMSQMIPGVQQAVAAMDRLIERNRDYIAEQQRADPFASTEAGRFDRLAGLAESLARIRSAGAEKLLSIEQQISALQERRDQAITEASTLSGKAADDAARQAAALERQLQALQVRRQNEQEAAQAKADQLQASRDELALRTRINEAIATGNQEEQKRLQWLQDFQSAMRQTGSDQVASRAAADEAQAVRDMRQAEAERLDDLREEIALLREQAQTRLAELQAAGATESQLQEARIASAEQVRAKEIEIAQLRGEGDQAALLQAEGRKQEQIRLAELKEQEAQSSEKQLAAERAITAEQATRNARGSVTSPWMDEEISAATSGLDRWERMQQSGPIVPPPIQAPPPAQPQPAPAGQAPGAAGAQPGQQPVDSSAITQAMQQAQQAAQQVMQAAVDAIKGFFSGLGDMITGLKDAITGAAEQPSAELRAATQAVNSLSASIVPLIQQLKQEIETLRTRIDNLR